MLPDMSAKVSFLTRRLAPEEMKPRLAAGRSALIDRNGKKFAYLRRETGSGRRRSGLGQRLAIWWRFTPPLLRKIRRIGWKQGKEERLSLFCRLAQRSYRTEKWFIRLSVLAKKVYLPCSSQTGSLDNNAGFQPAFIDVVFSIIMVWLAQDRRRKRKK